MLVQDKRVGDAEALNIAGKDLCALGVYLVADEDPAALQLACQLRGLSAGRGAEVQHALAGLRGQQLRRRHGARLLQVV